MDCQKQTTRKQMGFEMLNATTVRDEGVDRALDCWCCNME